MKKLLLLLSMCALSAIQSHAQYYLMPIAGSDSMGYAGDGGPARQAALNMPGGLCRDTSGNLYIGDGAGTAATKYFRLRKIDAATGIITTIAGNGIQAVNTDTLENVPATSVRLRGINGICLDKQENIIMCLGGDPRVRKVDKLTGNISTVAGTILLPPGYSGDGGPATAAQLKAPKSVAIDSSGNIYIGEYNAVIRKVDAVTGIISTYAGTGVTGYSGDGGPATAAQFSSDISDLKIDKYNNLIVADRNYKVIRRIDATTRIITTIVGSDTATSRADGSLATNVKIGATSGITFDKNGDLIFNEHSITNPRISKVDMTSGIISTIAGNAAPYYIPDTMGDYRLATLVPCVGSGYLCVDSCNNIFFTTYTRIRALVTSLPSTDWLCGMKLTYPATGVGGVRLEASQLRVLPNPSTGTVRVLLQAEQTIPMDVYVTDLAGRQAHHSSGQTGKEQELQLDVAAGMYLLQVVTPVGRVSAKIVVE